MLLSSGTHASNNLLAASQASTQVSSVAAPVVNYEMLHQGVFVILAVMWLIVTFIVIERTIFFTFARRNARQIEKLLRSGISRFEDFPPALTKSKAPAALAIVEVRERQPFIHERDDLEDVTDSAYIHAQHKLHRHLWVLDTVVTAAPLLGLLGTILGIIETFQSLAEAGISDPSAVSRGIGVALLATAVGIATALFGLLFLNIFQSQEARMLDIMKLILMRVNFARSGSQVRPREFATADS
jgi:biopolymer transport protein ExbB